MSILITGATRGLGLATATAARDRGAGVLLAGRDVGSTGRIAARLGAVPVHLDLADLDRVRATARELPRVEAVICNAAVQVVRGQTFTSAGIEETFAVNHLAHLALVDGLLARPDRPRRIVFVSSDTHDPALRTGTPDPLDDPIARLAAPPPDLGSTRVAGIRRYVTTKQLAVATAAGLAREHPDVHVTAFNPGLMPGTGLARDFPRAFKVLWATVLKGVVVLPFASTPTASARALVALVRDEPAPVASGSYVDFRLRESAPSERAQDPAYQRAVLEESRALLDGRR